jgi:hypothetical protein
MRTVRDGKVAIKTKDMIWPYINIVVDGLACLVKKSQEEDLIKGLIPPHYPKWLLLSSIC